MLLTDDSRWIPEAGEAAEDEERHADARRARSCCGGGWGWVAAAAALDAPAPGGWWVGAGPAEEEAGVGGEGAAV